jgi:hypothetical protein
MPLQWTVTGVESRALEISADPAGLEEEEEEAVIALF